MYNPDSLNANTNQSLFVDIILSLTRTKTVGYLRDVRRLTVALSRARLGLYILGRRAVFETCFELKPAFDILAKRPDKLMLVPGEMAPTTRELDSETSGTAMENLEHLGQYVYDITQAKVKALGSDVAITDTAEPSTEPMDEDDVTDRNAEAEAEEENDAMREGAIE